MDMEKISKILGVICALLAGLWANVPVTLQVLLVVMILDIIAGFIRAYMEKTISSAVAWRGILKKVMTLVVILLVSAVQKISGIVFPATEVVAGFYLYYESLSLVENAASAGVPVPGWLTDALAQLNPEKNGRRITDNTSTPCPPPAPCSTSTPYPPGTV